MSDFRLYLYGDDILRHKTVQVTDVGEELLSFAERMKELMHTVKGVGLAANQAGSLHRLFVMHPSILPPGCDEVFINPEIIDESAEIDRDEEGCLSLLSIYADVPRAATVTIQYTDPEGNEKLLDAEGLLARAVQHELDHLNGALFVDHLSRLKRKIVIQKFQRKLDELREEGQIPGR